MSAVDMQPRRARPAPPRPPSTEWRSKLLTKAAKDGSPVVQKCLANVALILRHDDVWSGALAFDVFGESIVIRKTCPAGEPGKWTDVHDLRTAEWMQRSEFELNVTPDLVVQAVLLVARENEVDPLRDHIVALKWDGVARLDTWLVKYLGVDDSAYSHEVGSKFLIGAVARALQPGCKVDTVLVTIGKQGARKSTAARIIAGAWFTDELQDLSRPADAALQLLGRWVVELAELDALTRADVSKVKAFISRGTDRFRKPYGRHVEEHPRRCVFLGTSNVDDFQRDETGGRRFWPVRVGAIDVEALRQDRDQLIAEAAERFRAGEPWWLTNAESSERASEAQASVFNADAWEGPIAAYLETPLVKLRGFVTVAGVLEDGLGLDRSKWGQTEQNRVARCMRTLAWERHRMRNGAAREWRYVPTVQIRPMATGDNGAGGISSAVPAGPTVPSNHLRVDNTHSLNMATVADRGTTGPTGPSGTGPTTGDSSEDVERAAIVEEGGAS